MTVNRYNSLQFDFGVTFESPKSEECTMLDVRTSLQFEDFLHCLNCELRNRGEVSVCRTSLTTSLLVAYKIYGYGH